MVSSTLHLLLSSLPFLGLFLYFAYSAYNRPSIILNYDDDVNGGNDGTSSLIPLSDMLLILLGNMLFWSFLLVYLAFFVRKRRRLVKSYLAGLPNRRPSSNEVDVSPHDPNTTTTTTIVGYVLYNRPSTIFGKVWNSFTYTDKAYLVYRYPEEEGMFVQKEIRTYHPYHRENVSILLINGEPLSGLPKDDVERDVGSFTSEFAIRNRDKIHQVIIICALWFIVSMVIASFILNQIAIVDEIDGEGGEDWIMARNSFIIMMCVIIPIVAIMLNVVRWIMYRRWVVKGGKVVQNPIPVPRILERNDFVDDQEASRYVSMT